MKNSKSLKVKRFVLFMFATLLCFFIAQIGAGFLSHKPYYADAGKASIVGNEIHYYNNDGETEVIDIDALCDEIISGLLPPEPESVEYVLTRTEVEDGVYNMSFLPLSRLEVVPGMEVAYANENGEYIFPSDPNEVGAYDANPGVNTWIKKTSDYTYGIYFGNWNPDQWDVSSVKVTTDGPPTEHYTKTITTGDKKLGTVTSGTTGSATYGKYFSYSTSTTQTTKTSTMVSGVEGMTEDMTEEEYYELLSNTGKRGQSSSSSSSSSGKQPSRTDKYGGNYSSSSGSSGSSGSSSSSLTKPITDNKRGPGTSSDDSSSSTSSSSTSSTKKTSSSSSSKSSPPKPNFVSVLKDLANKAIDGLKSLWQNVVNLYEQIKEVVTDTIDKAINVLNNLSPHTPTKSTTTVTTIVTTYKYGGNATYTYSASPNKVISGIRSFTMPDFDWTYSIKKSTLYIKDGLGRTNQVTQAYGTTYSITKDSITTGQYGTTTISSRNNQNFTYTGRYLSGWSKTGGGSLNGSTFTFSGTNATVTAVWSPLKYAIVWHDKDSNAFSYNGGLNYGGSIGTIPEMVPTPGYSGDFYMSGAKVTNSMLVNFSQPIMHAYYQEKARNIAVTWDGNGGTFADGEGVAYTLTTFNQNYVMPPEVVRPGYVFDGWYTGTNPNSTSARKITSSSKFTNVSEDKMHARWKLKNNLTVRIFADEQLRSFNLNVVDQLNGTSEDYNWWQIQGSQNRLSNIYGCTQFVFSDFRFNQGWVLHNFTVKNTATGLAATEGLDYKIEEKEDKYIIHIFDSIEITVNSCIRLQIKSISNFYGQYEINDVGGTVSVNGGDYSAEVFADVQYGDTVDLSAKALGTKVVFKGYYSRYSENSVNERDRLSSAGQLDWTSNPLTSTGTIYAVFYFQLYTINIYGFSDTKNFTDKQNLTQNQYDEIGGKVSVKAYHDDNAYSYAGFKSLKIADGYSYSFGIMVNSSEQANTRYKYVGIYYSLSELLSNKANDDADITSVSQRFTVNGKDVTFYAKFVLEYAFTLLPAEEGMDKVFLGDKSGAKGVTEYYYYGEAIDRISSTIDTRYYQADSPAWKVVTGTLSTQQNRLLAVQTITNGLVMTNMPIEIEAQVVRKFFTLTVFAIYAEMDMFEFSAKGGTANITTSKADDVKFSSNNGVMGLSFSVSAQVIYKSEAITLVPKVSTNYDYGTKYQFVGWYDSFEGFNLLGERLDKPEDNGEYKIPSMQDGMTFYCAFAKSYYVQVSVDDRVNDVIFEGLDKQQETNPTTGITRYFTYSSYASSVTFELVKERGEIDKFYQTQGGPDISLSTDETKTIYNFTMPNYPIYIEITTKGNKFYALTLRAVLLDDMQALYDDDEGFEKEVGDVRATEVDKVGSTVALQVEETRTRTLLATPGVGYSFFGWYKLRTDVSFTKIMKDGAPSYTNNIDTWLNIYNPTSNPNGAYVYFGSDAQVVSDPIERSNKNLYVAVFVKDYTITLTSGDKGIEELGFEVLSPYDRNSDGEQDALDAEINDQGSTVTITVPYGSQFDVWSKIRENYTFASYDIVAGNPSLSHYTITDSKILADNPGLDKNKNYLLEFYLYDNIKLISRTETTLRVATVNVYTLDTNQLPVLSMEGGTFNMATQQGQSFDLIIGASLIGFVKVNPGFVFSHFEIGGETQEHNVGMPAEDCELNVYFARNAYILNTFIKTIGDDGILADNENGGHVDVNHSILFGDSNTLNLTASMGYVLQGIYLDENCTVLAPNYDDQIAESERIEDYQFYYTYTTETLTVVPETPKIPAFNFYIVYKFLLFDIDTSSERTDLNTNAKTEMIDGRFDVFDVATNLMLTQGYYGEKVLIDLPENEDLRYYNSYILSVFDKTNNAVVDLFYDLEGESVLVEGSELGCLSNGITAYFIMPLGEIEIKLSANYHQMNLVLDSFSNTGTFDNEYVQAGPTGYAELSVFYNFNNYQVKHGTELKLDPLLSGVPYATKQGFKLVAYNTEKDRSGIDFITYQYDADDVLVDVVLNDFVYLDAPQNFAEVITLYAIYDYANIEMLLNYTLSGEEFYNGSMQALIQVDIYNYNPEIPYVYKWFDKNNSLIGKYEFKNDTFFDANDNIVVSNDFVITKAVASDKVINVLQLRSVNQTGTYTCVVSIDGGSMFENREMIVQEAKHITIMPLNIVVNISSSTPFFGATTIEVTNSNTAGLLPIHTISGTVGMTEVGVYNNSRQPNIQFMVENQFLSEEAGYKITSQDGYTIASNYTVSYEGECEIKEPSGLVTVSSGVYFRSVDLQSLTEVLGTTASTDIKIASMEYPDFVQAESKSFYGKLTNFVADSASDFDQTITLKFDYNQDYGFYKLYINGEEIVNTPTNTVYTLNETTLTFNLAYDYITENAIDIRIYLTNDCLVTAHYNVDDQENYTSRQVYNEEFKAPPAVEGKKGYVFEGWYFDTACTQKVPEVWQVRGTQNIYANWALVDVSSYLEIVVTDNGEARALDENNTYTKNYDGNKVALNVKVVDIDDDFSASATWYKKDKFASWIGIANVGNIVNVTDGGEFTCEITVTGPDGKTQTISYGKFIVKIVINPHALYLEPGLFDKTYDGKTTLSKVVLVKGLSGGQVEITGQFASKDVAMDGKSVADIEILNVKLLNHGEELGVNYAILNEKVYGKINPKPVKILAQKEKVYNGAIYSEIHEETLTNPMEVMTYKLETTGVNAGRYAGVDGLVLTPLTVASYLSNYEFSLAEASEVVIAKAEHKFEFKNQSLTYDTLYHKLEVLADGQPVSLLTEGVKTITYTYNGVVNKTGVINAGTYKVVASVQSDENFEDWNGEAYLTIKKLGFALTITMDNGQTVSDKAYTGNNFYGRFEFATDLSNEMNSLLELRPYITRAGVEVLQVKDVATYKIGVKFNETNFAVEGQGYTYFNIFAEALSLSNLFEKTTLTYEFNGVDQSDAILTDALGTKATASLALCDFNIQTITKQDSSGMFVSTNKTLKDAGNYQVRVLIEVKDQASYTLANGNYEEATLEVVVNQFEITKDNIVKITAEKSYDGKATFENAIIEIDVGADENFQEKFSGAFNNANAGDKKDIVSFALANENNYKINDNVYNFLKEKGKITPQDISIKLLKGQNHIPALYQNNQVQFEFKISRYDNQQYVSGLAEGEFLEATIVCQGNVAGEYDLSLNNESGTAYLDWTNSNIVLKDGTYGVLSNYNIAEIDGGINLIEGKQIVAEVVLNGYAYNDEFNNIYSGAQKGIFVKFNGILANYVFNGDSSKFVSVDGTALPAEISLLVSKDNPTKLTSGYVEVDDYTLTLVIESGTDYRSFAGGTTLSDGITQIAELVNEYTIVPFEVSTAVTKTIEFGDALTKISSTAVPTIDTNKTIAFEINVTNIPNNLAPRTDTYDYVYNQGEGSALTVTTTEAFAKNYKLKVTVQITVQTKKFIINEVAFKDLTYTMTAQNAKYDESTGPLVLTPVSGVGGAVEGLYSIKYYYNYIEEISGVTHITKVETDVLKNVGLYSAVLSAENYQFKIQGEEDSKYRNNVDLGNFEIKKAKLEVVFDGEREVEYNKQFHTPAKVIFKLNGNVVENLLHTITYTNEAGVSNLLAIQESGTYTAQVAITSDNFEIGMLTESNQYKIAKYVYTITPPQAGEVWISKYFGKTEPVLEKTFITEFGDELKVRFERTSGESVGAYKLSNPEFVTEYANYTLASGFVDSFGAFHILSYKDGTAGQLTIKMIKNIEKEYDGKHHSTITISDFSKFFEITDADGIADPSSYDISVEFAVKGEPARNVGSYEIEFLSVVSTTHNQEDILLDLSGYRFVITQKLLTFNVGSLTKVYDGTTGAEFSDVALNGICESDIGTLKVQGTFDNKNIGENKTITVTLVGENSLNYAFESQTTTGSITPRHVSIEGELVKEYDGTDVVNTSGLTITNVCDGETINLVGKYNDKKVGISKKIDFDLQDENYTIGEDEYLGAIVVKNLSFAGEKPEEAFAKEYDGNANSNIQITDLIGIVESDDVTIESAVYVDKITMTENASEGNKFLVITLGGQDKGNYAISNLATSINARYITIVYHYGDEEGQDAYTVSFVEDDEIITQKLDREQKVRYGYKIDYLLNEINVLAQPERVGYNFVGWTLDKDNTKPFTAKSNTNFVSIEEYNQNGSKLHLYADWKIKTFDVWAVVLTQNANNDDYSETTLGGTYKINGQEISGKLSVQYFTDINLEVFVNENFEFVKIERDNATVSTTETFTEKVKQNSVFNITIDRKILTVNIDLGDFNPSGYDSTIWTKQGTLLVASQKYMTMVKLPQLMVYGYDFMGFVNTNTEIVDAGSLILFETDNQVFTAKFEAKTIEIVIDTAGGIGDESFDYVDPARKTILVKYGDAIGNLPLLAKPGYLFKNYSLYNALGLVGDITSQSILKTAENGLIILANWGVDKNTFKLQGYADVSGYENFGITDYETFEMPYEFYYNLGQDTTYTLYSGAFEAETESTVRVKLGKSIINGFKFAYWQVEGNIVKIADEQQEVLTIGNTTFALVEDNLGAYILEIKGFVWGDANPEIIAVFAPETYAVYINEFNANYGNVEITSGAKLVNGNYYTLSGAVVEVSYTENTGYTINLDRTRFEGVNAEHNQAAKTFTLSQIKSTVVVDIQFTKNKFTFGVEKLGAMEGIAYIKYSINAGKFENYNMKTSLKTEDILQIQVGLLFGYTLSTSVNNPGITLTEDLVNKVNVNLTDYFYTLTGFAEEFLVMLDIGKLSFNVSAEQKLYNSRTDSYTDITTHTAEIKNAQGEVVTEIPYLDEVLFSAKVTPTEVDVNGTVVQNIEYNFLGWFTDKTGEMLLVSTLMDYRFEVADNTKYYAVFEPIKFSVRFEVNDDLGTIVDENNNPVNRSEYVNPGATLLGTYVAQPLKGYKFVSWTVSYTYTDAQKTNVTESGITQNPLSLVGEIHANIVCTPTFDKRNISINVKANRIDSETVTEKTQVQSGEYTGTEITFISKTRTQVVVKAIAQSGYAFVNWAFDGVDDSNYNVLKTNVYDEGVRDEGTGELTSITSRVHELYIEFIGDDITTYNMIANFEIATVNIDVSFTTPGVDVVASGVIEAEDGTFKGDITTFTAKTNSSLVVYLNVFKGFLLNDDAEKGQFFATDENITVEFEDVSADLNAEQKEIFDHRYKVTISNYNSNSKVYLFGNTKKVNLHFAKLLDFFENTYEEDVFQGYIRYYTSTVVLLYPEIPEENPEESPEDAPATEPVEIVMPNLLPKFNNCIFLGWSTTQNKNNLVIDENGVFIPPYWTILEDTHLYPIFEYASVRVDVTVAPLKALVNPYDYMEEVFSSIPEYMYMLNDDNNYLFDIGVSFGLNVPALKDKYHFDKFTYYVVDDNNIIKLVEYKKSDTTINFSSTNLFNIPDMKAFEYSKAINYADFSGLEDAVMYITIACNMDIDYKVENYYSDNRENVLGGMLEVPNLTNLYIASYGQEITLKALADKGYEVKEWWANNRKLDTTAETITYVVQEPTVFMVKFIGKQVEIKFNLIGAKEASFAGGNIDDSGIPSIRHVGDIINIFAEAHVGFNFTDTWLHSNGTTLTSGKYLITAEDGIAGTITLTPVCEERSVQVYIVLPLGLGVVEKDGRQLTSTRNEQEIKFLYSIKYTESINLTIKALQRYKVSLVTLLANGNETDVTEFVKAGVLNLTSSLYNNASSLTINVDIAKTYWMDLIKEKNLVSGQGNERVFANDFAGSGKQTDPYKITSVEELVQLAYVVNEDMLQTNSAFKNAYNRASTYYEIVSGIDLSARFWTPIGTSQNPFNSNIVIYNMPSNIMVDTDDPYYGSALFDQDVLKQFSGLFGYLGPDATIELKIRDFYMILVILAVLVIVILIIVFILVITHKIRNESVKNFDQKNEFLFDEE